VDITSFQVDPTATCGDPGSSSTGALTIETSTVGPDGPWTVAAQPTFDATDRNRYNPVLPTAGDTAVKAVKVTITGNQVPDFVHACAATPEAFGGCTFTDLTEFAVLGAPAP
jgi:extracellular elastinolytic metalloproteinase